MEYISRLERRIVGPEFVPGRFVFCSDSGDRGATQDQLADRLHNEAAQGHFFAGDNNFTEGAYETIDPNWIAFQGLIDCGTVFPALGNLDLDTEGEFSEIAGGPQLEKFGVTSYYDVVFDRGDIHLFVLNSGVNSANELVEANGNTKGSAQYDWLLDRIDRTKSKYKVVMFHHPFLTTLDPGHGPKYLTEMDWDFQDLGINLIINGHTRANEHLFHKGVHIINISMTGVTGGRALDPDGTLRGAVSGDSHVVWQDRANQGRWSLPSYGVITADTKRMKVEIKRVEDKTVAHSFYAA